MHRYVYIYIYSYVPQKTYVRMFVCWYMRTKRQTWTILSIKSIREIKIWNNCLSIKNAIRTYIKRIKFVLASSLEFIWQEVVMTPQLEDAYDQLWKFMSSAHVLYSMIFLPQTCQLWIRNFFSKESTIDEIL